MAPQATSTKNGSPSATCATTFWAACEASGEMTEAAIRAVVAMAVCFFCLTTTAKEEHWLVMCIFRALALSLSVCVRESVSEPLAQERRERR